MAKSQRRLYVNGVNRNHIRKDVVVSPGQTSHEAQVAFDRYQATVPKRKKWKVRRNRRKQKSKIRIATWNVRTLYQTGKKANVEREMERMNLQVLGLSEVRWPGVGVNPTASGGTFIYSGGQNAEKGVGVMLSKFIKPCLIGYWAISERVLLVRLKGAPFNICIIQVYAPTSEHDEEEVDQFYQELDQARQQCKEHEVIMVIGDLNAKVGQGRTADIVGPHGLGRRNDRGDRFVNWCLEKEQIISNTWFKHHPRHLWTWKSPGDRVRNQIDFLTINRRFRNSVNQVKTYPGADCNSDHVPVVATVMIKLKNLRKSVPKTKRQLQLLKTEEVKNQYNLIVSNRYEQLKEEGPVFQQPEQKWQNLERAIKEGNGIIPEREMIARKEWMTEDILRMMDERRQQKGKNENRYRELDRAIKRECTKAKEKWMDENCKEVEDLDKRDEQRKYEKVKEITFKKKRNISTGIKKADGTVVMESEEVLARWTEYIAELFVDDRVEHLDLNDNGEGPSIIRAELEAAVKQMKKGKAMGDDEIAVEMLVALGEDIIDVLMEIVEGIYERGEPATQMYKSTFITLPKVPGTLECNKHRTISIMSQITKIILRIVLNRIRNKILPEIGNEQFGFIKGKGTRNAIFILRMLMERAIEVNKDLYVCFVDYEKAFDRVKHVDLIRMLEELNIDGKDLRLIKNLYWNQEASVKVGNDESETQYIKRGVRQGCVLSPDLFNLYSELIMRDLRDLEGIKVGGVNMNNIRYADDTAIVADSHDKLQALISALDQSSRERGLSINIKKTEVMVITKEEIPPRTNIRIGTERIKQTECFNYLGCTITRDGRCEAEIKKRISLAKCAFSKIQKLVTNSKISMSLRRRFVKCFVWSVLLYGCETWTLKKADEKRLQAAEMWFWRRMLKISWTERRTNEEVLERVGIGRELLTSVRTRQMRFVGHEIRRGELEHLSLTGKIDGRRTRGRPRQKFMDGLVRVTGGGMSAAQLLQKAQDCEQWRAMIANVHGDTVPR